MGCPKVFITLPPQKEKVDLTDVVAERVAIFQKTAKQKKIQLQINFPKESVVINGNVQLLKRLFTNLLDNAVKYTVKGKVAVSINKKNNTAIHVILMLVYFIYLFYIM